MIAGYRFICRLSLMKEETTPRARNRCVLTVDLRFFEDQANGEWGLTHKDTMESRNGTDGFNAFWDGQGIYHDIWEHAHEFTNPFFRNEFAMNVGGEMAAMGAMWYYYSALGVWTRLRDSIYSPGQLMRQTTEGMVTEAISEGYCQFGDRLESGVPRQGPVDDCELEHQIKELVSEAKAHQARPPYINPEWDAKTIESIHLENARHREYGEAYRRSVTFRKVADLHRWGYRYAEKLVPNTYENKKVLIDFITFWNDFCKRNQAEDLNQVAKGIEFKLYRNSLGDISWKAWLIGSPGAGFSKLLIHKHFSMEDVYSAIPEGY